LFKSQNIDARITGSDVVPRGYKETQKAIGIPMFRFASDRRDSAEKLGRMIDAKRNVRKNPLSQEEIEFMKTESKGTKSLYEIQEAVFDRFKTTIDHRTIGGIIEKERRKGSIETPSRKY
jgi:hypothetical protein